MLDSELISRIERHKRRKRKIIWYCRLICDAVTDPQLMAFLGDVIEEAEDHCKYYEQIIELKSRL